MFSLGVITDEVSQDFEEALRFAEKHQLTCVELRSVWEKGPFEFTRQDIEKIKSLSERYGIPVVAVSSPFYKCSFFDNSTRKQHMAGFEKLVENAVYLGAKYIRCFDFLQDDRLTEKEIAEAYEYPIRLCERAGLTILIESEPSTNSKDCKALARLVEYINHPVVQALYDPGNNIYASDERPYPDGFACIRRHLAHVHIKDAVLVNGRAEGCVVGEGEVDYRGIFRELFRMGYSGAVMLETHYKPTGKIPEEVLKNPKGSAISFMGDAASAACLAGLKKIIEEVKSEPEN